MDQKWVCGLNFLSVFSFGLGPDDDDDCDCVSCEREEKEEELRWYAEAMEWDQIHQMSFSKDQLTVSRKMEPRIPKPRITPEAELEKVRRKARLWKHKKVKVGYCSDDLLGKDVHMVYTLLHNQAFSDINLVPVRNTGSYKRARSCKVKDIIIENKRVFMVSDYFAYDSKITIYYYDRVEILAPASAESYRNKNIQQAVSELKKAGFTNFNLIPKRSPLLKQRSLSERVVSVSIAGKREFCMNELFMPDDEIKITYYK